MELKVYPDRVLRTKCLPLKEVTDADLAQARQMLELMYESDGIGLAAPQVGWDRRIVTLDVEREGKGERIFVNPLIRHTEDEVNEEEGCLSVPGIWAPVRRAAKIVLVAYTIHGERVEQELEGLLARVWQHELDHLNGVLFIDHLPPTTLMTFRQKLRELEAASGEAHDR